MTIKVREPGDAFKRQVSEFVPVKKRRPWRDEEPTTEVREVQGASSSMEEIAIVGDSLAVGLKPSSIENIAIDEGLSIVGLKSSTIEKIAIDEDLSTDDVNPSTIEKIAIVEGLDDLFDNTKISIENKDQVEFFDGSSIEKIAIDEESKTKAQRHSSIEKFAIVEESKTKAQRHSSIEKFAIVEEIKAKAQKAPSIEKFAIVEEIKAKAQKTSSIEKIAIVEDSTESDKRSYARYVRQPFRSLTNKEAEPQTEIYDPLPGTHKTRAAFVFYEATKRIDNPSASLLYCYLWHQAEEVGSARLKISMKEMAAAICVSTRTLTDAAKRLADLGLFENVNLGKTTVPVVRLGFNFKYQ